MRRSIAVCVVLGATSLGCSSPPGERLGATGSALSACEADPEVVTLTGFSRDTLVLTAVNGDGEQLSIQYSADTTPFAADIGTFEPPDPCFAQATAWNHQVGRRLTQAVIERLAHFAQFTCNASVQLGEGNVILSFRPVAFPPEPT